MSELIALLDMDGTVADYDAAMRRELERLRSPNEPPVTSQHDANPDWIEARRRLISMQPGFWRNLPRLDIGFEIVKVLEECGFYVHVLTKGPKTKPQAWTEKVLWCDEHLPNADLGIVKNRKDLTYGRILVDDWQPYFSSWLVARPRGIVIAPAQPWNKDAEEVAPGRVYRYDGTDPAALSRVIQAVRDRQDGEALDIRPLIGRI